MSVVERDYTILECRAILDHNERCIIGADTAVKQAAARYARTGCKEDKNSLTYWGNVLSGLNWSQSIAKRRLAKAEKNGI